MHEQAGVSAADIACEPSVIAGFERVHHILDREPKFERSAVIVIPRLIVITAFKEELVGCGEAPPDAFEFRRRRSFALAGFVPRPRCAGLADPPVRSEQDAAEAGRKQMPVLVNRARPDASDGRTAGIAGDLGHHSPQLGLCAHGDSDNKVVSCQR
ncbi:MAG TPA: hypothetical protein VGD81_13530 [Opitutaceae bacterium]